MRMEVLSSSYSRAASPLSSGAVDGLAGAGAGAQRRNVRRWPARPAPGPGSRVRVHVPGHGGVARDRHGGARRGYGRPFRDGDSDGIGQHRTGSCLERALCARRICLGSSAAGAEQVQVQVQAVRGRRLAAAHVHLEQRAVPSIALVGQLEPLVQVLQTAHIHQRASRSAVIGLASFTYK